MIGLLLVGLLLILIFGALGFAISPLFFLLLVLILVAAATNAYLGHRHS
jgi:hypothetical protein